MAQSYRVPEGVRPQLGLSFTGILSDRGSLTSVAGERRQLCRGVVEVVDRQIDVIGFGQMADALASVQSGTVVSGDGELQKHEWTVGDGGKRETLCIELESLTSWQRAEKL